MLLRKVDGGGEASFRCDQGIGEGAGGGEV